MFKNRQRKLSYELKVKGTVINKYEGEIMNHQNVNVTVYQYKNNLYTETKVNGQLLSCCRQNPAANIKL